MTSAIEIYIQLVMVIILMTVTMAMMSMSLEHDRKIVILVTSKYHFIDTLMQVPTLLKTVVTNDVNSHKFIMDEKTLILTILDAEDDLCKMMNHAMFLRVKTAKPKV